MQKLSTVWLQRLAVITLIFHTSAATIIMRRSRNVPAGQQYSPAMSVLLGELIKISLSVYLHKVEESRNDVLDNAEKGSKPIPKVSANILQRCITNAYDIRENMSSKMMVPASLYVLQNCLQIYSISHITTVEYQAMSQFKIIAIGIFSISLLGRKLKMAHWISMCSLILGVTIMQASKTLTRGSLFSTEVLLHHSMNIYYFLAHSQSRSRIMDKSVASHLLGISSVMASCILGSYAGVYLEKAFKSGRQGLWSSNAQLSFFSMFPALFLVLLELFSTRNFNPFHYFGFWAWLTVIIRGLGGITVAIILKYCDNIVKAFATSMAIVLSMTLEAIWTKTAPNSDMMIGASVIITSTMMYSYADRKPANSRPTLLASPK